MKITICTFLWCVVLLPSTSAFIAANKNSPFIAHRKSVSFGRHTSGHDTSSSTSARLKAANNHCNLDGYEHYSIRDSFNLIVLGDLHLEDDMSSHEEARADCISALKKLSLLPSPPEGNDQSQSDKDDLTTVDDMIQQMKLCSVGDLSVTQLEMLLEEKRQGQLMNCQLVSLGDLGRKDIRHEPGDPGTAKSFADAKGFLDGFQVPYDLVTGNHDLEGLDEFDTDEENLQAWMDCFGKDDPYFAKQIGEKTLLVGLSTVRFRDAPHSSHECHADDDQLEWFEHIVKEHSHEDGWRICVFTHAPIMGSKLRVLQNVHVVNGCAWMNHCSPTRSIFIETIKQSPQIKLWCSGHFHLSHDFPDSLTRVNQCTFMQVGVVGKKSTRDHTRQTRIVQGNSEVMKIYTIEHHKRDEEGKAEMRLDATIDLVGGTMDLAHGDESYNRDDWFSAFIPQEEDGCYLESPTGTIATGDNVDEIGELRSFFVEKISCLKLVPSLVNDLTSSMH